MGRPRKAYSSRKVEIRLQIAVEPGSAEEIVLDYLNNHLCRPFDKSKMFMQALIPFWYSLALLHQNQSPERILQVLEDSRYCWEAQEQYLRRQISGKSSHNPRHADSLELLERSPSHGEIAQTIVDREPKPEKKAENQAQKNSDDLAKSDFNPFGSDIVSRR